MLHPTPRPNLAIQRRTLHRHPPIRRIKPDAPDGRGPAGDGAGDVDLAEEGRDEEVDVLAGDGPEAEHGEGGEGGHGAAIVVAGDADDGGVELGGDVGVGVAGGEGGTARVVGEVEG